MLQGLCADATRHIDEGLRTPSSVRRSYFESSVLIDVDLPLARLLAWRNFIAKESSNHGHILDRARIVANFGCSREVNCARVSGGIDLFVAFKDPSLIEIEEAAVPTQKECRHFAAIVILRLEFIALLVYLEFHNNLYLKGGADLYASFTVLVFFPQFPP